MNAIMKPLQNNMLEALSHKAPAPVVKAIKQAASRTGVDFSYLLQQAGAESSFRPELKAKTSSATGLYQFIESTWMNMVERFGDEFGFDMKGKSKKDILALRKDPEAASLMAARFASENQKYLENHYDGPIGATELYFAHFMGASGASNFLKARAENPLQNAADIFPRESAANIPVFFDKDSGQPRSLEEVYQFFDKKFSIKETPVNTQLKNSVLAAQKSHSPVPGAYKPLATPAPSYNPIPGQSRIANMIELLMLTQLDIPFAKEDKS